MKNVKKIGRFNIVLDGPMLGLRWKDLASGKWKHVSLRTGCMDEAETKARQMIDLLNAQEAETASRRPAPQGDAASKDPLFCDIWPNFEARKAKSLTRQRYRLLCNRRDRYFKDYLWTARVSGLRAPLRRMINDLEDGSYMASTSSKPLSPNTIQEIARTVIAVCEFAYEDGLLDTPPPRAPKVHGTTSPLDRKPRGRHLRMEEIGALIDACRSEYVRDLLLLTLGCGARVGAIADIQGAYVHFEEGVIDLLGYGELETNKRRPIVPISGPMEGILRRLIARHGSGPLLHSGAGPLRDGARNWTQLFERLVDRSGITPTTRPDGPRANWYAIRHTFAAAMDQHVRAASLSSVMGHMPIERRWREQLFDAGSPMTKTYKLRELKHVIEVGEAADQHWWPEIQKHCRTDLGLKRVRSGTA